MTPQRFTNIEKSTSTTKRFVKVGDTITKELPYSEVCLHLRLAGTVCEMTIVGTDTHPAVQLLRDGRPYSIPITLGEAGIYDNAAGRYYYNEP